jgi:tRNA pseudouridine55 synthase
MIYHGFLVVNKEVGVSSHKVVENIRRILGQREVGHTGTLDPNASGVLLVVLGKALKAVQFLPDYGKEYLAKVELGRTTDTYDVTGKTLKRGKLNLNQEEIKKILYSFLEQRVQKPPLYSAIKHKGKRLYQYALKGEKVELKERRINIKNLEFVDLSLPYLVFKATVSSGTYIRSLAFDLGEKLGCGATLVALERTAIGPYQIENGLTISQTKKEEENKQLEDRMISVEKALRHLPGIRVRQSFSEKIADGPELKPQDIESIENEFASNTTVVLKDYLKKIIAVGTSLVSSLDFLNTDLIGKIFTYRRVIA